MTVMTVWGTGPFENETARDWTLRLIGAADWTPVEKAFERLSECAKEDPPLDEAERQALIKRDMSPSRIDEAVAAADVVAVGLGMGEGVDNPYVDERKAVVEFLDRVTGPSESLLQMAREAVG